MNSYTIHINLYDLAFLGAIFIGLTFTFLLWFTNSINRRANRFLALALLTMIVWMMRVLAIDIQLENNLPHWDWLPMQFLLALGPLIYFYVVKITRPAFKFSGKHLFHFVPLLLEQAVFVLELRESAATGSSTYTTIAFHALNPVLQLLIFISNITYLYYCNQQIQKFYRQLQPVLMDRPLVEFRWLRRLLGATALLWMVWLVCAVVNYIGYRDQPVVFIYYPFYIFFVVIIIWTATAAFLKPQAAIIAQTVAQPRPLVSAELRAKGSWLKNAMKANRYYEDPELNLRSLAEKLGLPHHELSRIINTALKKNFNDFINEYRVLDVVSKMKDPAYDNITLLGIAFDAGFNSKATFNRTFRQMTGKSPAEFKNNTENKDSSYHLRHPSRSAAVISNRKATHLRPEMKLNRNYMFKSYFKSAARNLARNKIYSFINIAGLSIGLACAMLILLYVKDEVSFDRFHKNADNVYRVVSQWNKRNQSVTGHLQGPRFTQNVPGIRSFVRVENRYEDIKTETGVQSQSLLYVDSNFFSVFTFPLVSGNAATCLKEPRSVVLSEDAAKKQFGTKDAAGRFVMLKEDSTFVPYKVTAVAKRCPQNSSIRFDVLLPFKVSKTDAEDTHNWFNSFLHTFVVLDEKADRAEVEKQMQRFYVADAKQTFHEMLANDGGDPNTSMGTYLLQPFTDIHLNAELPASDGLSDAGNPVYSYMLSGIALFVLLIACINFVNLTIARSIRRAKEVGIRKVIGAERKQLVRQFLGESFFLCFIAFVVAIVIAQLMLPLFNNLANKALSIFYLFDAELIAGYITLFGLTALLAGFYPALVLSGYQPVQTLYSRFQAAGKNYLQKSLVVLQFMLASFLIIATFTIYAQFNFLTKMDLGYDDHDLVIINKNNLTRTGTAVFKSELMKNPNIVNVAVKNNGEWYTATKNLPRVKVTFANEVIDENYLPLLKVPFVAGRNFSTAFPADSIESVIVNESFVKAANWKNPIGETINILGSSNQVYRVIGVVKDYHFDALTKKITPQLFSMNGVYGTYYIRIKPNTATASLKWIQKTYQQFYPMNSYSYVFKNDENRSQYAAIERWKQIILSGAVLTIFISCIGLFGLSVLAAEKRTKEIGIRKVLGASVRNIVTSLSTDFIKLVLLALLIAIPFAWLAAYKWLQSYPYRIPVSWWLFASAGILVLLIALLTISFQSIKAAMANPVKSLRTE